MGNATLSSVVAAQLARANQLGFLPDRVGVWWDRTGEVDVVAARDADGALLLGECKRSVNPVECRGCPPQSAREALLRRRHHRIPAPVAAAASRCPHRLEGSTMRENSPNVRLEDFPARTFDKVRYADTDRQGHVNNAAFSSFCETGRVTFLFDPQRPLNPPGTVFVIARLVLDFRDEIRWPGTGSGPTQLGTTGQGCSSSEEPRLT